MSNKPTNKNDCIAKRGRWIDPPGECEEPYELMDTSLINADANDEKKESEAKGGVWKEPPGECEEPKQ
ncbi:hypothetical protein NIES4073_61770 [Kalymmatonema gypsitolerans NIES-4073]|nr:hypothetical protein NIES4073_61770 [Scytonema sp. NIES-4073]